MLRPAMNLVRVSLAVFGACLTGAVVLPFAGCSSSSDGGTPVADTGAGADVGTDASPPEGGASDGGRVNAGAGVLQHHGSGTRGGLYVDPAFTKAAAARIEPLAGFAGTVPAKVFAQPLFLEKGAQGKDALFVVTEGNDVIAMDADSGAPLWKVNLGTPMPASAAPQMLGQTCGSIWPLGITSTPVIDLASGSILVVAMTMNGQKPTYQVFALSLDDGSTRWSVDLGATVTGLDSGIQIQRGALALQGDVLYIPFGAQAGECGDVHGWVVTVALAGPHAAKGWHTASVGSGIWGPSGAASDGTSVFVSTAANATFGVSPRWADGMSEAILRIGPDATFSQAPADYFAPTDWFGYDIAQTQLGSAGVVLLDLPGSTPSQLAFAIGKTSDAYLVDRGNLGGVGPGVAHLISASSDWIEGAMAAYTTPAGGWIAFNGPGSWCPTGTDLTTLKVAPGAPPKLETGWCATQGGVGSPMVTASAPGQDVVVWGLGTNDYSAHLTGSGKLRAFDGETGTLLAESPGQMPDLEHWITPIAVKGRIYVAGDQHVYAWDLGGSPSAVDAGPPPPADAGPPAACLIPVTKAQALMDACVAFGLTCQGTQTPYGACQTPGEGDPCKDSPGCATGLKCVAEGAGHVCRASCTKDANCSSPFRACVSEAGGKYCTRVDCDSASFYKACQAGTDTGTCVPFYESDGTTTGRCLAGGSATGSGCSKTRGGPLCASGSFCYGGSGGTACAQLCDYTAATFGGPDAGPACPSGQTCIIVGTDVQFGVCAPSCTGASDCTAPLTCQTWNPLTSQQACLP